jgi:hypothetical protein
LSLPDIIQQRLSLWKPHSRSATTTNDGTMPRVQSKLIPHEHRQPAESVTQKTALNSGSLRVRKELSMSNLLKNNKSLPPAAVSDTDTSALPIQRRPSLLLRTFALTRKSKQGSRSRDRKSNENLARNLESGEFHSLPDIRGKPRL